MYIKNTRLSTQVENNVHSKQHKDINLEFQIGIG